ncbi:hypothetical protein CYMTET_10390 [Cymbomonas tetramitiformis]|uniref:WW domain-containing protein n=1 Tax=Cymbomonas tetramitiformis TaxID=36881 RepID=A0AAE0GPR6_9CHLO|nr:hypothetical protein CYMTET_10390 [Cymbomonas tetramitiformis]
MATLSEIIHNCRCGCCLESRPCYPACACSPIFIGSFHANSSTCQPRGCLELFGDYCSADSGNIQTVFVRSEEALLNFASPPPSPEEESNRTAGALGRVEIIIGCVALGFFIAISFFALFWWHCISNRPIQPKKIWKEVSDKRSGDTYWWNTETNETRWTPPSGMRRPGSQESEHGRTFTPPDSGRSGVSLLELENKSSDPEPRRGQFLYPEPPAATLPSVVSNTNDLEEQELELLEQQKIQQFTTSVKVVTKAEPTMASKAGAIARRDFSSEVDEEWDEDIHDSVASRTTSTEVKAAVPTHTDLYVRESPLAEDVPPRQEKSARPPTPPDKKTPRQKWPKRTRASRASALQPDDPVVAAVNQGTKPPETQLDVEVETPGSQTVLKPAVQTSRNEKPQEVRKEKGNGYASAIPHVTRKPAPETDGEWTKVFDPVSGLPYYWNVNTDETTWERPDMASSDEEI